MPRYRALLKPVVKSALIVITTVLLVIYIRREFVPDDFETEPIRLIRPWGVEVNSAAIFKDVTKYYSMTDASKACETKQIAVSVITGPNDQEFRDMARNTWVQDLPQNAVYRFIIGAVTDSDLEERLFQEQSQHHDIIRYNLSDSYHRLVLKSYIAFDWTSQFCEELTHFVKIDVDVYPNIPLVLRDIERQMNPDKKQMFGEARIDTPVLRWPNKNYILSRDLRGDIVPPFSRGALYVYTKEAVKAVLETTRKLKIMRAEDVFFNGLVCELAGIERISSDKLCANLFKGPVQDALSYCELTPELLLDYHEKTKESKKDL